MKENKRNILFNGFFIFYSVILHLKPWFIHKDGGLHIHGFQILGFEIQKTNQNNGDQETVSQQVGFLCLVFEFLQNKLYHKKHTSCDESKIDFLHYTWREEKKSTSNDLEFNDA